MTIDKSALLAALACTTVAMPVEGFGTVNIRQVSVAENDRVRAAIKSDASVPHSAFGLQLLIASVVNDDGSPVFTEADLPALQQAAGRKVDKLVEAVLEVNGYGGQKVGNVQASGPTTSDASASDSPSPSA
jgi:hypothetical protein